MITYGKWAPTSFDAQGLALPERHDWLVAPCVKVRGCGTMDASNFEVQLEHLGAAEPSGHLGGDVERHTFGHWGPGSFEIVLVRPLSPAAWVAMELEAMLANHPVLDEDRWSALEYELAQENWERMSVAERVHVLQRHGRRASIFAARRAELPDDETGSLVEYLATP